jgi:serine/threonine protein kinase
MPAVSNGYMAKDMLDNDEDSLDARCHNIIGSGNQDSHDTNMDGVVRGGNSNSNSHSHAAITGISYFSNHQYQQQRRDQDGSSHSFTEDGYDSDYDDEENGDAVDSDEDSDGDSDAEAEDADEIVVKLADFGMAGFIGRDGRLRGRCGTPGYVAPDIINAQPHESYHMNVDMFSVRAYICAQKHLTTHIHTMRNAAALPPVCH